MHMISLVLLPGLDGTGKLFEPLVAKLPSDVCVQIIRYPNDPSWGYSDYVAYVRAALPKEGNVVLVGESFSGPIAIQLAAEGPNRMAGVVLCCTFARNPRPNLAIAKGLLRVFPFGSIPRSLITGILLGAGTDSHVSSLFSRVIADLDPDLVRARLGAVLNVNVTDAVPKVGIPVKYLQATHDRLVPTWCGEEIRALGNQITIDRIAGPHALFQAAPARCAEAILEFMKTSLSVELES